MIIPHETGWSKNLANPDQDLRCLAGPVTALLLVDQRG